ncbi:MAG: SGNH/GDSL hydrolase family protein [Bacteroidota bacterium]
MLNFKYVSGAILSLPMLPIMYYQGKRIRASVPALPAAKNPSGVVHINNQMPFKLVTLGESTIAGIGVKTHEEGFSGTLAKSIANFLGRTVEWQVFAHSGYTAKAVTEKIVPNIPDLDPDLIVIGLGGNDAFKLNSPSKWQKDITNLIQVLQEKFEGAPIVFTNMPPIKEFPAFTPLIKFVVGNLGEMLGTSLKNLVKSLDGVDYYSRKITLGDWVDRLEADATVNDFFSDGVHPSKLTYQVWAKDFCNYLVNQNIISQKAIPNNALNQ